MDREKELRWGKKLKELTEDNKKLRLELKNLTTLLKNIEIAATQAHDNTNDITKGLKGFITGDCSWSPDNALRMFPSNNEHFLLSPEPGMITQVFRKPAPPSVFMLTLANGTHQEFTSREKAEGTRILKSLPIVEKQDGS